MNPQIKQTFCVILFALLATSVVCQPYLGTLFDVGESRNGEHRGDLGPAAIAGLSIGALSIVIALIVTIYFCYYANQSSRSHYSSPKISRTFRQSA